MGGVPIAFFKVYYEYDNVLCQYDTLLTKYHPKLYKYSPGTAAFRMLIGDKLRLLREGLGLSQGDIEERTGLKRSYISRMENGHTVPAIETLEKIAHALDIPLYRLFYEGEEAPKVLKFPKPENGLAWGNSGEGATYLSKLCKLLPRIEQRNRNLLLATLKKMTRPKPRSR